MILLELSNAEMLAALQALPMVELIEPSTLDAELGADSYYSARTVVELLRQERARCEATTFDGEDVMKLVTHLANQHAPRRRTQGETMTDDDSSTDATPEQPTAAPGPWSVDSNSRTVNDGEIFIDTPSIGVATWLAGVLNAASFVDTEPRPVSHFPWMRLQNAYAARP